MTSPHKRAELTLHAWHNISRVKHSQPTADSDPQSVHGAVISAMPQMKEMLERMLVEMFEEQKRTRFA